jgi:hypothetical protein
MTITLPDALRDELEAKARAWGYSTVDQYLVALILDDSGPDAEDRRDVPVPEELAIKDRADLEAKIREGLASGPPIRVTPEYWDDLKRRIRERAARPKPSP